MLGAALTFSSAPAAGQVSELRASWTRPCLPIPTDDERARLLAPLISFHPSERYFPTLPYFPVFFDGDGLPRETIALDPDTIAPRTPDASTAASWALLRARYDRMIDRWRTTPGRDTHVPPAAAVFYDVVDVDESALMDFLRSDRQAWERNRMERMVEALRAATGAQDPRGLPSFKVVRFFFYYVNDTGIEGHPEDIEFAFFFTPADPVIWCRLTVIVGAGHADTQPNNILVELRSSPDRPTSSQAIIVELGGHASAPDAAPFDADFVLGEDVNWGLENVWGVRDLLAVSGQGVFGPYRRDLTLPRPDLSILQNNVRPGVYLSGPRDYALIPIDRLRALEDSLSAGSRAGALAELRRLGEAIRPGGPVGTSVDSLPDETFDALTRWARPLHGGGKGHRFWNHQYYEADPVAIFKRELYREAARGPVLQLEARSGLGADARRVGLRFPVGSLRGVALSGYGEITVGWTPDWSGAQLLWDSEWARPLSFYGAVAAERRTERSEGVESRVGHVRLSAGATLWPWWFRPGPPSSPWRLIRIRTGPSIEARQLADGIDSVAWSIGLVIGP